MFWYSKAHDDYGNQLKTGPTFLSPVASEHIYQSLTKIKSFYKTLATIKKETHRHLISQSSKQKSEALDIQYVLQNKYTKKF